MKNLEKIKEKYGTHTPYTLPENYFEGFNKKLLESLPPKPEKRAVRFDLWSIAKPLLYVAASLAIAMWSISLLLRSEDQTTQPDSSHIMAIDNEHDAEAVSLNLAVDDYSLYEYLNEESAQ